MGELEIVELAAPAPGAGRGARARARLGREPDRRRRARAAARFDSGHARVVPDHDGAGEIVAVGEGVPAERVGERVWLWLAQWRRAQGTAAQFIALPVRAGGGAARRAPRSSSAPGLGIPALTAHRCLFADGPIDG